MKEKLDYHYAAYNKEKIPPDPLQFLHRFRNPGDTEIIGLISSIYAYGNVKQINKTLEKIILIFSGKPFHFIKDLNKSSLKKLSGIKHRFYTEQDTQTLLIALKNILNEYGSIKAFFLKDYNIEEKNLKSAISSFSNYILGTGNKVSPGFRFMFPLPEKGSACKRMNLFLRWMIRKDKVDLGVWNEIPPSKLIIPVDTHIARISRELGLTTKKNVSWNMAEEITDNLRKYDPNDPVKYDFALCHIGMGKQKF